MGYFFIFAFTVNILDLIFDLGTIRDCWLEYISIYRPDLRLVISDFICYWIIERSVGYWVRSYMP